MNWLEAQAHLIAAKVKARGSAEGGFASGATARGLRHGTVNSRAYDGVALMRSQRVRNDDLDRPFGA